MSAKKHTFAKQEENCDKGLPCFIFEALFLSCALDTLTKEPQGNATDTWTPSAAILKPLGLQTTLRARAAPVSFGPGYKEKVLCLQCRCHHTTAASNLPVKVSLQAAPVSGTSFSWLLGSACCPAAVGLGQAVCDAGPWHPSTDATFDMIIEDITAWQKPSLVRNFTECLKCHVFKEKKSQKDSSLYSRK